MDASVVLRSAGFVILFRSDGTVIDVWGDFEIGLGVVLEEALWVIEEIETELLVIDDGRNLA